MALPLRWTCLGPYPSHKPQGTQNAEVPLASNRVRCQRVLLLLSGCEEHKVWFRVQSPEIWFGIVATRKRSRGRPQVAGYNQRKLAKSLHTGAGRLWQITQSPNCYQALVSCNRMGFHQEILTADQNPESISSVTDGIINNLRC